MGTVDYSGFTFEDWVEVFNRYDRLDVPVETRQELVSQNIISAGQNPKKVNKQLWDYLKNYKLDDDVIMYRGFTVAKDEDVRLGRKKVGNPNSHQQVNGVGFAYSIKEQASSWFSHRLLLSDDEKPHQQIFHKTVGGLVADNYLVVGLITFGVTAMDTKNGLD